jgi:hypothetical protein
MRDPLSELCDDLPGLEAGDIIALLRTPSISPPSKASSGPKQRAPTSISTRIGQTSTPSPSSFLDVRRRSFPGRSMAYRPPQRAQRRQLIVDYDGAIASGHWTRALRYAVIAELVLRTTRIQTARGGTFSEELRLSGGLYASDRPLPLPPAELRPVFHGLAYGHRAVDLLLLRAVCDQANPLRAGGAFPFAASSSSSSAGTAASSSSSAGARRRGTRGTSPSSSSSTSIVEAGEGGGDNANDEEAVRFSERTSGGGATSRRCDTSTS